jgi:PhnB protein
MPLEETFWGAYFGMCEDKFGVNWMINFDMNQS